MHDVRSYDNLEGGARSCRERLNVADSQFKLAAAEWKRLHGAAEAKDCCRGGKAAAV